MNTPWSFARHENRGRMSGLLIPRGHTVIYFTKPPVTKPETRDHQLWGSRVNSASPSKWGHHMSLSKD